MTGGPAPRWDAAGTLADVVRFAASLPVVAVALYGLFEFVVWYCGRLAELIYLLRTT